MNSVSKTSKVTIIRRPDYARKNIESVTEVDISNKDSQLDNNMFSDLVFNNEQDNNKKKKESSEKHPHLNSEQKKDGETKNEDGITDFYV